MEEFIYLVGETLMMEIDWIENISYDDNSAKKGMHLKTKDGKTYCVEVTEIKTE